jgi:hypothetical protein
MGSREERIGLNEAVFREVNERIENLAEGFALTSEPLDLVCECGDASCRERITMSHAAYEQLRSNPRRFAVYPGHEAMGVENVVERREGYVIVEKETGAPERIAEQTDPRAG